MKLNETEWNWMKWNWMKWNEIEWNEVKWNQPRSAILWLAHQSALNCATTARQPRCLGLLNCSSHVQATKQIIIVIIVVVVNIITIITTITVTITMCRFWLGGSKCCCPGCCCCGLQCIRSHIQHAAVGNCRVPVQVSPRTKSWPSMLTKHVFCLAWQHSSACSHLPQFCLCVCAVRHQSPAVTSVAVPSRQS